MNDEAKAPIVVKRIKKGGGGHHGGAWKIAYADFVTAMMAFFLLMWLLGSTTKGDLLGIAEFFQTPLKVALAGGSGSGDSSSVLKGGGTDLTRRAGQVKKGDVEAKKKTINIKHADSYIEAAEVSRLKDVRKQIEKAIESNKGLRQLRRQLLIDFTSEGLRIQMVDVQNRPMFETAKADLQPYTRELLQEIGRILNGVPNHISLSGHTDSVPYSTGDKGYSNWELSADRANASRRELIAGGMDEAKVLRVVGLASIVPLNPEDPTDPVNRRISIIVLNKRTEDAIARATESVEAGSDKTVSPADLSAGRVAPPAPGQAPDGAPAAREPAPK
jgi:chemotaxis protein MotB